MHYYQFNIKSYNSATNHLSNGEDLAYRRLMDFYYANESSIPAKPDKPTALVKLARRLRLDILDLEYVLDEYFIFDDKCWKHEHCDEVIADYRAYLEKQRANGRKGGRGIKRIEESSAKPNKPTALPKKPNAKPTINHKPETINNKKPITPIGVSDEVFQDFLKLRGTKAPVTETAIRGLERESKKAGLTLQEVLELCCKNGWRGFEASWLNKSKSAGEKKQEVLSGLTRGLLGGGNANILTS